MQMFCVKCNKIEDTICFLTKKEAELFVNELKVLFSLTDDEIVITTKNENE